MLRCSDGYTKRANSVTPLYESALAPDGKIAACERFYASQGLPCRSTTVGEIELRGRLFGSIRLGSLGS